MPAFFPKWKCCTSYRTLLFTRSCGFHCQGWSDWQSPVCCQQTHDLKGHWAVLGTILLDLVAFPGSCIQCLSWKWLDTVFTIPHVQCFPCRRARTLMVDAHWRPVVIPGIFPQSRGSCTSWVQPMTCLKSTKTGILLLWVKNRISLLIQVFLDLINPHQRLCCSYLLCHLLCVSDP